MTSQSSKIMRKLAGKDAVIFNDKLVDGTRSYKVWGWKDSDYQSARTLLMAAGFEATIQYARGFCEFRQAKHVETRIYVS